MTLKDVITESTILVEISIRRDLVDPERRIVVDAIKRWVEQHVIKTALH